ncbi:hypothetical protein PVAG01_03735 [Phlyctema vagabunda]|uniref:Uncharacterized protein n=1 Tax=Phlyctema vagabunda TaxID=108571 RepID=A0ABR4PMB9_9HELO
MRSFITLFTLIATSAMAQDSIVGDAENCAGIALSGYCCPGLLVGTNGNLNSASDGICCVGDPNRGIDNSGVGCTAGTPIALTAISGYVSSSGTSAPGSAATSITSGSTSSAAVQSTSSTATITSGTRSSSSTGTTSSTSSSTAAAPIMTAAPWIGAALGAAGIMVAAL